ncbi:MAG TPA: cupin domain-containing protein [Symbiobacteriaceae bacterium]|nr:cupin domain-containing protein [Symbiobacteriaceae bacterium]
MERVHLPEVSVPSTERFTKKVCFNYPQAQVFVLTFSPGQALPPHRHPGSVVVLQVWSGTGLVVTDGQESPIAPGDVLFVTSEEELALRNTGDEPLAVLVTLTPNPVAKK